MGHINMATPRPWRRDGKYVWKGGEGNANVCACGEPHKGDFIGYTELALGSPDAEEAHANAALIVRAVNAHNELIEALTLALGTLVDRAPEEQLVIQRGQLVLAKAEGR